MVYRLYRFNFSYYPRFDFLGISAFHLVPFHCSGGMDDILAIALYFARLLPSVTVTICLVYTRIAMQKLYAYVDESGQDTEGERFYVAVVVIDEVRDELERQLLILEQSV